MPRSMEPISSNGHRDAWNMLDMLSPSNSSDAKLGNSEVDRRFMMFYFDRFFPFLFPFTARGWTYLDHGACCRQAGDVAHPTLPQYILVSVTLDGATSGPNVCKTLAWEKLLNQMSVTFMMLQHNLQEATSSNTQDLIVKTS